MDAIIPYNVARQALADAKAVDDVKDILDKSAAMKEYARRSEDRSLEIDAAEIRFYALRRLGQMIQAQEQTFGLNRGRAGKGRPKLGAADAEAPKPDGRPKLADMGISHKLSSHAQKMAAVPPAQFETRVSSWRDEAEASRNRVTVDLLKFGEEEQQRQARRDLATTLSDKTFELTGRRKVACVYADPAVRRKAGDGNRSYENHYPTMSWDEIMAMPIADLLLPDSWVFIWLPRAHLLALHPVTYKIDIGGGESVEAEIPTPLAWAIARAWGCDSYSTCHIWSKVEDAHPTEAGTGLIWRDQNEVLCLFKKGRGLPMPAGAEKYTSEHRQRSKPLGHSRKPQFYREMIAVMTGGIPVIELFARDDPDFPLPPNWEGWGNEAASDEMIGDVSCAAPAEMSAAASTSSAAADATAATRKNAGPTLTATTSKAATTSISTAAAGPQPVPSSAIAPDDVIDVPAFLSSRSSEIGHDVA